MPPADQADQLDERPSRFGGFTAKATGVAFGLLLMATVVVPWGLTDSGPIWGFQAAYTEFTQPDCPTATGVLLVGMWALGFAAFSAGVFLKRLPLAVTYLAAAAAGTFLLALTQRSPGAEQLVTGLSAYSANVRALLDGIAEPYRGYTWIGDRPLGLSPSHPVVWGGAAALGGVLLITRLRMHMGGHTALCVLQILAALGLIAAATFAFLEAHPTIRKAPELAADDVLGSPMPIGEDGLPVGQDLREAQQQMLALRYLRALPLCCAWLVGGLIALLHGLTFSRRLRWPAGVAFWLVLLSLVGYWAAGLVLGTSLHRQPGEGVSARVGAAVLLAVNPTIFLLFLGAIGLESVAGLIADSAAACGVRLSRADEEEDAAVRELADTVQVNLPSAPVRPADREPAQRLEVLKDLYRCKLISEQEYEAKRKEILEDL